MDSKQHTEEEVEEPEYQSGRSPWAAILFIILTFFVFLLNLLGISPLWFTMTLFFFFALGAAISLWLGGRKGKAVIIFIIMFFGFGFASWWMVETPLGKQLVGKLGIGGVQLMEGLRGLTGPINIMMQIFKGTYNPENLWQSNVVESQYEVAKDVGVTLVDVKALREIFEVSQELVITGRINAVGFPGTEVTAALGACEFDITRRECKSNSWNCIPSELKVREARNRVFTCKHPPIGKEATPYTVNIEAKAEDTILIAGKQFVFASTDALLAVEPGISPLDAFGVPANSLKSWQKGDSSVNLGIDISGRPEVLETDVEYFLGVSVENPVSHTGTAFIKEVEFFIPAARPNLGAKSADKDFICNQPITQEDIATLKLPQGVVLNKCVARLNKQLKPGDFLNSYIKIKIAEDELVGQDFSTFFVLARLKYDYSNSKLIPLTVKELT
ncbi:MAG: hypothetical protein QW063_00575 [Candidatus Nanoarchaeia archaeon]